MTYQCEDFFPQPFFVQSTQLVYFIWDYLYQSGGEFLFL